MASKRVAVRAADINKLINTVNFWEVTRVKKFKAVCDAYDRSVSEFPENPPPIDWNRMKSMVSNKEVVDKLKASYDSALQSLPYPKDTHLEAISKAQQEAGTRCGSHIAKYEEIADECSQLIEKFEQMIPFHDMSMETLAQTFPKWYPSYKSEITDAFYGEPTVDPRELENRRNFYKEFDKEQYGIFKIPEAKKKSKWGIKFDS